LRALKAGEAVGILPDQTPGRGEGEWAEFFGRPAYTMTLVQRLAEATGAPIVLVWGERLPRGAGYRGHAEAMPPRLPGESAARHLNRALEGLIRRCPEQYLWSYNRYKRPPGVEAPPQSTAPAGTDAR
jgi:KDO2-lipid IV(A) lauroyltransferase